MASGAWAKAVWLATAIARGMWGGEERFDVDPFRLFGDSAQTNVLPYDPSILQALQDDMDQRRGGTNLPYDPSVLQAIQNFGKAG